MELVSNPPEVCKTPPPHRPKMDVAKALSVMGLSSSRQLDPSIQGNDPTEELRKALAKRMHDLEMKDIEKREAEKAKKKAGRNKPSSSGTHQQVSRGSHKGDDRVKLDLCKVHEAYQFLYKRYCADKFRMAAHAAVSDSEKRLGRKNSFDDDDNADTSGVKRDELTEGRGHETEEEDSPRSEEEQEGD